jgi:hypothetical protein
LGITPGSKVEFDVVGGGARLKLVKKHAASRVEEGAASLNYQGPRISVDKMHGGRGMKRKAAKRARLIKSLRILAVADSTVTASAASFGSGFQFTVLTANATQSSPVHLATK